MTMEDDRIEKLKRKLYSRTVTPILDVRSPVKPRDVTPEGNWGNDTGLHIPETMTQPTKTHPFLKKFLFSAILFFVICVAVSAYIFFGGGNLISSNNVDIKVAGPSQVASGEEVDLALSLVNQNSADLQSARLITDYPDGTMSGSDSNTPLTHTEEEVGTIAKGSAVNWPVKLFLFGDKGTIKTIKFQLEFNVAGSNAVFTKEKDYDITIASSPVILNVDSPVEVNSGQDISFTATITSNSASLLHNVLLLAQYPYGFTYKTSSMQPVTGSTQTWNVGDLKSGDKKTVKITGSLQAQDGEQRTFHFSIGTKSADPTKDIDTVLSQAAPTITVKKPFIDSSLALNGISAPTVPVMSTQGVGGMLHFTNTLSDKLTDVSVVITVSGNAFDPASVQVQNGGFYQSADNTIRWDKNSTSAFSEIDPGNSTDLQFSFNTLKPGPGVKNPSATITALITGSRTSSDGGVLQVSSNVTETVDLIANLALAAKTLHRGPFTNTGPVPPKANVATTYTIDWVLSNMWNDVSGAKVTTTLPAYVDWTGQVSPTTADILYDPSTRTVTWSPDAVSAGAGFSLSAKEVFFQLKFNPSLSQVSQVPALTSSISLGAKDNFSSAPINFTLSPLTTQTSDTGDQGIVTQ